VSKSAIARPARTTLLHRISERTDASFRLVASSSALSRTTRRCRVKCPASANASNAIFRRNAGLFKYRARSDENINGPVTNTINSPAVVHGERPDAMSDAVWRRIPMPRRQKSTRQVVPTSIVNPMMCTDWMTGNTHDCLMKSAIGWPSDHHFPNSFW
jgi:hypothetical protein